MWNKLPKAIVESNSLETLMTNIFKYFTYLFSPCLFVYLSFFFSHHVLVDVIIIGIILIFLLHS